MSGRTELFRNMLHRGLRLPTTVTSDGAPGLVNAIIVCFPTSIRIRCWFHRLAELRAKLPRHGSGRTAAPGGASRSRAAGRRR